MNLHSPCAALTWLSSTRCSRSFWSLCTSSALWESCSNSLLTSPSEDWKQTERKVISRNVELILSSVPPMLETLLPAIIHVFALWAGGHDCWWTQRSAGSDLVAANNWLLSRHKHMSLFCFPLTDMKAFICMWYLAPILKTWGPDEASVTVADPLECWTANVEQQTEVKIYSGVGLYSYSS